MITLDYYYYCYWYYYYHQMHGENVNKKPIIRT